MVPRELSSGLNTSDNESLVWYNEPAVDGWEEEEGGGGQGIRAQNVSIMGFSLLPGPAR